MIKKLFKEYLESKLKEAEKSLGPRETWKESEIARKDRESFEEWNKIQDENPIYLPKPKGND